MTTEQSKYAKQNIIYSGSLNPSDSDELSEAFSELLKKFDISSQEILRLRICVEEVMDIWAEELGEDTPCRLLMEQRFRKTTLILQADGKEVDPTQYRDKLLLSVTNRPNIAVALDLPAEYRYEGGRNELLIHLPSKRRSGSGLKNVLIAIVVAVVLGLGLRNLAEEFGRLLAAQAIEPIVGTITSLLRLIAGPLVFLSIFSGISGVGDAASFGKIGSTVAKRLLIVTIVISAIVSLCVGCFFPISFGGQTGGSGEFSKLLDLILNIVPGNIITPFETGNALQIIFIAVGVGVSAIVLNKTVLDTIKIMNQLNAIVQRLMATVRKLFPLLIFLTVLDIILTSDISALSQIIVPLALASVINLIIPVLHGIYAAVKTKYPLFKLLKAQLPTYLLALTTSSSSAAFSTNVECCKKDLHIDAKLVHFGVPFGQVIFMPGTVVIYIVLSFYLAVQHNVSITPVWIFTLIIVAAVFAVATPPVAGGALSQMLILLSLMGIPAECMAICAVVLPFSDYFETSCAVACLQQELLITAHKLGLVTNE